MSSPKISVVIVYKNQDNLEKCINSILKQTFSNIEVICVSNSVKDNADEIVKHIAQNDSRIKLICLPFENNEDFAKKAALGVAEGEFICFMNLNEEIGSNFLTENYVNTSIKANIKIEDKHLYRRTFLENDEEITSLINEKINQELEQYSTVINDKRNEIKKEFDKFYQTNEENMKSRIYEMTCRYDQLEKFVYDKENSYQMKLDETVDLCCKKSIDALHQVYDDISKVYDYVNSENNKKGCEVNKVYEEITKNYHYTEELTNKTKEDLFKEFNSKAQELSGRLSDLEKEIIIRYVNLKRLMDIRFDELNKTGSTGFIDSAKVSSDNSEKIYEQINKNGEAFYSEMTNIYKEINDKILVEKEYYNGYLDKKLEELRNEFNAKIENIIK